LSAGVAETAVLFVESCNPNPAYYTENLHSPDETLTYSLNVDYDSGAGSRIVRAGVQ